MEDFYKKLRDNLNDRPEPSPEDRHWERMNKLLDKETKTTTTGYWHWVAAAVILLLLGSNIWWWQQSHFNQKRTVNTLIDTVYQTKIIYQTDTIFKEKTIVQIVDSQPSINNESISKTPKNILNSAPFSQLQQAFITSSTASLLDNIQPYPSVFNTITPPTSNDFINKNTSDQAFKKLAYLATLTPTTISHTTIEKLPKIKIDAPAFKLKKDLGTYLYAARPKAFLVGIYGGWSKPFNDHIDDQSGQVLGATLQTILSNDLRLWASFDFTNNRYDTRQMNEQIGVPLIEPPADNYVFEKAIVRQSLYQYGMGLQYHFRASKKIQPFFGVGYGVLQSRDYEIVYEFEDKIAELELEIERDIKGGELIDKYLLVRSGVSYLLSDHWEVQFMANYRQQIGESVTPFAQALELKGGIFYQF